jgi:hypothetical protein
MKYLKIFPAALSAGLLLFGGASGVRAQATERAPSNATARCKDGSYSAAKNPRGACARHRGIAQWLADSSAGQRASQQVVPAGATARCGDGTYSKSNGQGACSRHGGVTERFAPTTVAQDRTRDSDARQDGKSVAAEQPTIATARCNDGTASTAATHRGACARHGGVAEWLSDTSVVSTSQDIAPAGATARCKDGTYSKSAHRSGTCSYHGGVVAWLRGPGGQ